MALPVPEAPVVPAALTFTDTYVYVARIQAASCMDLTKDCQKSRKRKTTTARGSDPTNSLTLNFNELIKTLASY